MAEDIDTAQPADAAGLDPLPMRDQDGEIRHEFVEEISRAIHAANTPWLRATVAELHEADLGDLIAALEPDDRVSLVELTGADFDFSALNEVDGAQHGQGAVSLDALLRSGRPVPLADLIDEDRRRVSVMDDQEEVARLFGKYNLVAAPVVDTANRLVGVITVDDVVDVIEEEAEADLKALRGVTRHEELSDNGCTLATGRFNWLMVNLATAFLASSVLCLFLR